MCRMTAIMFQCKKQALAVLAKFTIIREMKMRDFFGNISNT
jgi:hypothetical protein